MTGNFNAGGNEVLGNTTASANLILESTTNATKGYLELQPNGGNVGIGTATPAAALDVNGGIDIKGFNAISFPPDSNTTGGSLAIGAYALKTQTSSESSNTAVGYAVMGYGTLTSTASDNSGVGADALYNLTSGSGNAAFGFLSLYETTSGVDNTALGSVAGEWLSGSYNTLVGYGALGDQYGGSYNVAVGYQAGFGSGGTASNNAFLGYQAGYDVSTGSNNTIIGPYPTTGVGITSGSNNILMGQDVRPPSRTASNQLNIGNLIYATGLGSGTTLSTGNVGIGTTTPAGNLDVENGSNTATLCLNGTCSNSVATTSTNGTVALGSTFTNTAAFSNTGLTVSLPSAGTYYVVADIHGDIYDSTSTGSTIEAELYNVTTSAAVPNTTTWVVQESVIGLGTNGSSSIHAVITVAGATTIALYGEATCLGTCAVKSIIAGGSTRMSYFRLN
jgi:hypothetical protein